MSDVITLPEVSVEATKPQRSAEASGPPAPPSSSQASKKRPSDELTLEIRGIRFTGWEGVRISRGVEIMPSAFALRLTERLIEKAEAFPIAPGEKCRVLMGDDLILTGYVDTYRSGVSAGSHAVTVTGRSCTQDLVDCQAGLKKGDETHSVMTFSSSSFFTLATDLCSPFGISVSAPDGEGAPMVSLGDGIPQITIAMGQTVMGQLEPIARWQQVILLDGTDGNLVIAKVGTKKAGSGFTMPGNVKAASVGFSKAQRFSLYVPVQYAMDAAFQVTQAAGMDSANYYRLLPDPAAFKDQARYDGEARYRPVAVVSEQFIDGISLAEKRAEWQKARDYGRSQSLAIEVPGWRDAQGQIWTPNTLAEIDIPQLKLSKLTWLIAEVTYTRDLRGTVSTIVLMPPEAFMPQPDLMTAFDPQVAQAKRDEFLRNSRQPGGVNFNPRAAEPQGGQ